MYERGYQRTTVLKRIRQIISLSNNLAKYSFIKYWHYSITNSCFIIIWIIWRMCRKCV